MAAFRLELLFLLFGGLAIGIVFGRALYLMFPILIVVLTLLVGSIGFVYFVAKGVPTWLQIKTWVKFITPPQ